MTRISIRRPWLQKPDVPVEINWDHPLADGLEHFYILNEGDGPPLDLVTGEYLSNTVGSPGWAVDEDGRHLDGDGTASYWGAINVLPYPITIAASGFTRDKISSSVTLGLGENAGIGGMFILSPRSITTDDLRVYCRSRSGQGIQVLAGGSGYNVNQNYTLAAVSTSSTDLRFFIDGNSVGSNSSNHGNNPTWDRLALMGLTRDTAGADHDGGVEWAGVWSRDLTDDEHAALHTNIFSVISPRTIRASIGAVGGDTALVASANGSAITTSELTTSIDLAGNASAQTIVAANLTTAITIATTASAQVNAAANLTTGIDLVAAAVATANTASDLTTQIPLSSSAAANVTTTANLTVGTTTALAASVTASVATAAELATGISLEGSASALASTAAQLTTGINMVSNVNAQALATADITTNIGFESAVVAQCGTVADMTTGISLVSNINAQSVVAASLFTGGGVGVVLNPRINILTTRRRLRLLTPDRRIRLQ